VSHTGPERESVCGDMAYPTTGACRPNHESGSWIMLTRAFLALCLLVTLLCHVPHSAAQARVSLTNPQVAKALGKLPKRIIVVSEDPIYQGEQRYEGFELKAFLTWLSRYTSIPLRTASITFIASDGYWSEIPIKNLPNRSAVLAFHHVGDPPANPFRDATHAGRSFNPGPYAVVWEGFHTESEHLPNPWSVTEVILQPERVPDSLRAPTRDLKTLRGLELWRLHCSRCHSINKFGGNVGPELNVPVNVTEYWSRERLIQFIENSASLRWNSKMPSFSWLPQSDREAILKYLEAMREAKVCSNESSCLSRSEHPN